MWACDRHFGIGADGVIFPDAAEGVDVKMTIYNADGSQPEMCGNGIRCLAHYWARQQNQIPKTLVIGTESGSLTIQISDCQPELAVMTVKMGLPVADGQPLSLKLSRENCEVIPVSMGNPHAVIFAEKLVEILGPQIENHSQFPNRTNVEFVEILSRDQIRLRVWERGVGETLACGTGACAAVVAGVLSGKLDRKVRVNLPGGILDIDWQSPEIMMTGPSQFVFSGERYQP